MKRTVRFLLITALIAVISVCGHELWRINEQYAQEAQLKDSLLRYRPDALTAQDFEEGHWGGQNPSAPPQDSATDPTEPAFAKKTDVSAAHRKIVNQSVIDLQNEVNEDAVGWLTVPNTHIDYPIVLAGDNDYYLERNIYGKHAKAGSIFMDYRCAGDYADFNTVIYGHNMKNGSMFGCLKLFGDPSFFESNTSGTLYAVHNTYKLEIFAYMVVLANDDTIYDPSIDKDEWFDYVRKNARQYREPAPTSSVVTLSTCAYEYDGARMVLLATMIPQ
jgi:sortase B